MAENKKNEGLNLQPQALEAEEAVLGSMMIDEDAANKAISILGSSHYFYKDSHRKIFEAMISLMNNNDPIDTVSVSDELKKGKNLKSIGGIYYLTGLVDKVPTSARVETYAEIVKEKGMLRDLISTSHEISKKAFELLTFESYRSLEAQKEIELQDNTSFNQYLENYYAQYNDL